MRAPSPAPGPGGDGRSTAVRFGLFLGLALFYAATTQETVRTVAAMFAAAGLLTAAFGALSGTPLSVRNFTYWYEAALHAGLCGTALLVARLAPGLHL